MDRLISEKQVLDAICHDKCGLSPNRCMSGITGECVQIKPIKAIPSAEPKWIPVSERLPEDSDEYLVSVIDEDDKSYKQVGVAWFAHPKDYNIKEGEWRELMFNEKVIAWMPLAKPYEPQERSEDAT